MCETFHFSMIHAKQECWLPCSCRASARHTNATSPCGLFVRKFQVVNRNDFFKKVSYSFHVLCLNIWILRACALPKPFNIFYFLPPGFLSRFTIPGWDDWHGFRLAIPFTSNAENRYSHSHSWACYSYSHTRTPHSHHYSHYRRTKHHDIGQPILFIVSHPNPIIRVVGSILGGYAASICGSKQSREPIVAYACAGA